MNIYIHASLYTNTSMQTYKNACLLCILEYMHKCMNLQCVLKQVLMYACIYVSIHARLMQLCNHGKEYPCMNAYIHACTYE